jgi:hypothetical protein
LVNRVNLRVAMARNNGIEMERVFRVIAVAALTLARQNFPGGD